MLLPNTVFEKKKIDFIKVKKVISKKNPLKLKKTSVFEKKLHLKMDGILVEAVHWKNFFF